MNKINFVNNSEPALSAENLNQMQDNIDNAKIEKSTVLSQVDINTIEDTSYYYCSNCENSPLENGYLFTQFLSRDYIYQTFINVSNAGSYERVKVNGVWGDWKQLGHIETITNENGTAIKYSDGTMICRKNKGFSGVSISNAWGGLYYSEDINCGAFAQDFVGIPTVTKDLEYSSGMCILMQSVYSPVDYNTAGAIVLCRPNQTTVEGTISITAIGRWK